MPSNDPSGFDDGSDVWRRDGRQRTRRQVLAAAGVASTVGLTGCLGGDGGSEPPDPVTLGTNADCDVCGMVIAQHPGPTAEIFYADQQPSGHDNPARFDSTWEAFQYDFERQNRGWERQVMYVTDYSAVDYDLTEDGGDLLISTHPEAEAFADASEVTFVAGSAVIGAMGRDLIGFGDEGDAAAFRDEHGGETYSLAEVTPEVVAGLGRD